ncbi:DNA biosynthesis protein [Vibrio anguillarum]|uniref:ATP-binding protein n=1 Tax=Vibrio anguillarum TaxID=55601 RepID=UPI000B54767A|nr:ATP-binding protein [Vibrio anguillarum]ASG01525.1 DNA biosynthesis protein [Vibrio anguillarum]
MTSLQHLQARIPAHIQPYSRAQMDEIRKREEEETSRKIFQQYQIAKVQSALGRSGIGKKHAKCRLDNYITETQGQRIAFNHANTWLVDFLKAPHNRSFVYSGTTGTGKNHLASAIGNNLLARGKSVMVISVSDLMLKIRDKYNSSSVMTEAKFIEVLSKVDLLVLDEVGVQRKNDHENIMLSTIIDARWANDLPTGILTNLGYEELQSLLSERVVERLLDDGGEWVSFVWESFRAKSRSKVGGA